MNWDKGPMEAEIYALEQTRSRLRSYKLSCQAADDASEIDQANAAYEAYVDAIEYMGHLTRFRQLEGIMLSVYYHEDNIKILDDCIQQVKDELGC